MNLIYEIKEAQVKVIQGFGSVEGREKEVWEALSPNAQVIWGEIFGGDKSPLINPPRQIKRWMEETGYGYYIVPPGNRPSREERPLKRSPKIIPFPKAA